MASLADVVSSYRKSGTGIAGSLAGGIKEKLKEKMDPRRFINQKGILPALFPGLKAFKASGPTKEDLSSGGSMSAASPYFDIIATNTKVAAKNSMALPLIHKDLNIMRQNMTKLVSLTKQRIKNDKKGKVKTLPSPTKTNTKTTVVKSEEEGGGLLGLLATLASSLMNIGSGIASIVKETLNGLASTIINGLKGLFNIGKLATSLIGSFMGPLLSFLISPIGLGLIFGAALVYALKNFLTDVAAGMKRNKEQQERYTQIKSGEANQQTVDKFVERAKAGDVTGQKVGQDFGAKDMPLMGTVNEVLKSKLTDDEIKQEFGVSRKVLEEYQKRGGKGGVFGIAREMGENVKGYEPGMVAIGDSIADGFIKNNGVDGLAKVGASPSQVLAMIDEYAANHNLKGKNVVLSTGASNNPAEIESIVPKQIEKLKSLGATPTILGTGPGNSNVNLDELKVNERLSKIATESGVKFNGPLTGVSADGIHPKTDAYKNLLAPTPTPVPAPKETGTKVNNSSQELKANQKKEPSETIIENKNIQQTDQNKAIPKTNIPSTWDRELVEKLFGKDTKVRIF